MNYLLGFPFRLESKEAFFLKVAIILKWGGRQTDGGKSPAPLLTRAGENEHVSRHYQKLHSPLSTGRHASGIRSTQQDTLSLKQARSNMEIYWKEACLTAHQRFHYCRYNSWLHHPSQALMRRSTHLVGLHPWQHQGPRILSGLFH